MDASEEGSTGNDPSHVSQDRASPSSITTLISNSGIIYLNNRITLECYRSTKNMYILITKTNKNVRGSSRLLNRGFKFSEETVLFITLMKTKTSFI